MLRIGWRVLHEHARCRNRNDLRTCRQRHRLGQRNADAQAGERTGTGGDVELFDVARLPVLRADQRIDDRNDLGGVLEAVLELLLGKDAAVPDDGDGADAAGSFNRERAMILPKSR